MNFRKLLFAACLVAAGAASAQTRTVPASEFYFDEDARTTRPVVGIEGQGDALVERLLKSIERNPRAKAETAQLAHLAMAGGRPELGLDLYQRVTTQLDRNDGLWRSVQWNYGWDLYRSGNRAAALDQWRTLLDARVTAAWMPPTFALVLWQLDRKPEAVRWYAAAVRSEPGQWRGSEHHAELLPQWSEADRAVLAQVQQAWAANPPAWP